MTTYNASLHSIHQQYVVCECCFLNEILDIFILCNAFVTLTLIVDRIYM